MRVRLSFDSSMVGQQQMEGIAGAWENVLRQLCDEEQRKEKLRAMTGQSPAGLDSWAWNAVVPESVEECIHDLVVRRAHEHPLAPAVCAWDGDLTYRQLDELSTGIARRLAAKSVAGTLVPLFFEKSMWMPVAAVAVMKAVETTLPEERLRAIAAPADSPVALSSEQGGSMARRLGAGEVLVVGPELLAGAAHKARSCRPSHRAASYTSSSRRAARGRPRGPS